MPGQDYDISIYISKHISGGSLSDQTKGFTDIDYVEFYFGSGWGNRIFPVTNNGGVIGINTSSWGSAFLAICRSPLMMTQSLCCCKGTSITRWLRLNRDKKMSGFVQ